MKDAAGSPILDSYEAYGCRLNATDPCELFKRYEAAGFLYPAKKRSLAPYMAMVLENWRRAARAGELIHWFASFESSDRDAWASISSWRSTHDGWNTQHLVGMGSPVASRAVMLAGQAVRIRDQRDLAHQNWFRPENRFANKIFGSLVTSIGAAHSAVIGHNYLRYPLDRARVGDSTRGRLTSVHAGRDAGFLELALRVRGSVFVTAEELDRDDILLDAVDQLYRLVGLRRYRRIVTASLPGRSVPGGAAIIWRGPLGFNFSFLENRCDLLLDPAATDEQASAIVSALIGAAASEYADFLPRAIPIVADPRASAIVQSLGGEFIRHYAQSIWLKAGYVGWYRHVEQFYEGVMQREACRAAAAVREEAS